MLASRLRPKSRALGGRRRAGLAGLAALLMVLLLAPVGSGRPAAAQAAGCAPAACVGLNGSQFVVNGQPFVPRGINLQNENMLFYQQPYDQNQALAFPGGLPSLTESDADYALLQSWGVNLVRWGFDWHRWANPAQNGWFWQTLERAVASAEAHHIYLVPTLFVPPGGYMEYRSNLEFWGSTTRKQKVAEMWKEIAGRYGCRSGILGYDILNEPSAPSMDGAWRPFFDSVIGQMELVDQCRSHLYVFEALVDTAFTGVDRSWLASRVVYSVHDYTPEAITHRAAAAYPGYAPDYDGTQVLWDRASIVSRMRDRMAVGWAAQNRVPLWVGEFGSRSAAPGYAAYVADMMDVLNGWGVAWTMYTYRTQDAGGFSIFFGDDYYSTQSGYPSGGYPSLDPHVQAKGVLMTTFITKVAAPSPFGLEYHAINPVRVLDTRIGLAGSRIGAGQLINVPVTSAAGVAGPVVAVSLNVTAVDPSTASFLSVWPAGSPLNTISNLNFSAGQVIANQVVSQVGSGMVSIYNYAGSVDVVADLLGYFTPAGSVGGGTRLNPLTPNRILDTRAGVGGAGSLADGQTVSFLAAGVGGVPADAAAVVLTVTVARPARPGFVKLWPHGAPANQVSNLNYVAGDLISNLVVVPVGGGGRLDLYAYGGPVDVIADVVGWFGSGGLAFSVQNPERVIDTRYGPPGRIGRGAAADVGLAGGPAVPADARAVFANITEAASTSDGFLAVYPAGSPPGGGLPPNASTVNFRAGRVLSAMALVGLSAAGGISIYNVNDPTDVVLDVAGYFS